ncbi:MAG: hypothetical protein AABZ47_12055 [Planctomycetota bacterium]
MSNPTPDRPIEQLLLDLHLNRLKDEERRKVLALLARNPNVRALSHRLARTLRPLDYWTIASPPAGLVDRILRRAEKSGHGNRALSRDVGANPRRLRFVPMRDLLAAAACIALVVGVMVPGLTQLRSRARDTQCETNLWSVYNAAEMYRENYDGSLPYAGTQTRSSWLPLGTADGPFESNSRHLYLLAKTGVGPRPESYLCPADLLGEPMTTADESARDDFPSLRNIGYDSLNLSGGSANLRPSPRVAYLSDSNPLFVGGRFHPEVDPNLANSQAHGGRGQAVVFLNGSTKQLRSPVFGTQKDNLWLSGNTLQYKGNEIPVDKEDSFLIPGFPKTDSLFPRP